MRLGDQGGEPRARLGRVSRFDQRLDGVVAKLRDLVALQAEIARADDLALVHRDAAENLREIFAQADPRQQRLDLAEASFGAHPARVGGHFLDRLDIGGEPGEPVRGVLFALDSFRAQTPAVLDPFAQGGRGAGEQRLDGVQGSRGEIVERHFAFSRSRRYCVAQCFARAVVAMRFWAEPRGRGDQIPNAA